MPDKMQAAMQRVSDVFAEQLAADIVYTRANHSVTLRATRGRSLVNVLGDDGAYVQEYRYDYSFPAADLVLGGLHALPRRGDRITTTHAGETQHLTVVPAPGEDCYRWNDAHGISLRVFTQQTAPPDDAC